MRPKLRPMFLTAESPTLEIDLSAEGHLYQLTIVGLWDGTTASLKIWSEILQDWMPLPSNWTADVNLPIRATSRKILLQLTGGTAPELGVQCLRLPLSQTPADAPGFYRNETTASFALSTADVGVYIRCLNAGAITIDVPTLVSEAIPLGSLIYFRRETTPESSPSTPAPASPSIKPPPPPTSRPAAPSP